jgi:hypothetical protein
MPHLRREGEPMVQNLQTHLLRCPRQTRLLVMTEMASLGDKIATLEADLERLRRMVEKLPRTADGVPVVPGMEFWENSSGRDPTSWHAWRFGRVSGILVVDTLVEPLPLFKVYSTLDAAEAASKQEGG